MLQDFRKYVINYKYNIKEASQPSQRAENFFSQFCSGISCSNQTGKDNLRTIQWKWFVKGKTEAYTKTQAVDI